MKYFLVMWLQSLLHELKI